MALRDSVPVNAVTSGPRHHFFGYYDKTPWDNSGRYLLALETDFAERMPKAEEAARIGIVDLASNNAFLPLAETRAWNLQQGSMLQWLPHASDRSIIFNHRDGEGFGSVILDVSTGERRHLSRPIYSVAHSGKLAVTLNFSRLHRLRPVTGYVGGDDPLARSQCPDNDGIYVMDLDTGENRLIISLGQIAALDTQASMRTAEHWFEHLVFSSDDSRFLFLHRWRPEGQQQFLTRLFTSNRDGSDIFCVADHDLVSHFDWKDEKHILAWARQHGIGDRYFLFSDRASDAEVIGEGVLTADGHCSFSPDGRWILTDTQFDEKRMRTVILYDQASGHRFDIGSFFSPPAFTGDVRCDLHPRWSRDGKLICIDSAHEGSRQMYVLDVSELVGSVQTP